MKIGKDFKLSKEYQKDADIIDIGGYKAIIHSDFGVHIQGVSLTSLFEEPIGIVGIMPLDEEAQKEIIDYQFCIEKHHLVYQVTYCGKAWYFNKREDAFAMIDLILRVKETALHNKFIERGR